jgi:glycosyltransferase involved in cell wall biosynthesis
VTGILVDRPPRAERIASVLASLLEDAERRTALGRAGRRRFEAEFTAERWIERLRPVYDAVIDSHGPRHRRRPVPRADVA